MIAKLRRDDPAFERKKDAIKRLGYRWTGHPACRWQKPVKDFQVAREKDRARNAGVNTTAIKYAA